jgi:DNA repair exonuclease SbcCD ATPase subunit
MKMPARISLSIVLLALCALPAAAQLAAPASAKPVIQDAANATDPVANELAQLRKSLQTLNTRLQIIAEELISPDSKANDNQKLKQIASNMDLLTHTEERAEVLRKQLIELIEKETAYRTRLTQMDEDMRPENIERSMGGYGTTRTAELRDTRRRSLESEKKGLETLMNLTSQSRLRLEEDVRQADLLVSKLRQRLFPLIDKQLDKLNPYQ